MIIKTKTKEATIGFSIVDRRQTLRVIICNHLVEKVDPFLKLLITIGARIARMGSERNVI